MMNEAESGGEPEADDELQARVEELLQIPSLSEAGVLDWMQDEPGEYHSSSESSFPRQSARNHFLWMACQYRPDLARELNSPLYGIFMILEQQRNFGSYLDMYQPPSAYMADAIKQWLTKWGLASKWIQRSVWGALYARRVEEGLGRSAQVEDVWHPQAAFGMETLLNTPRFRFEYDGWQPTKQTRTKFKEMVRKALAQRIEDYLDEVERVAEEAGFRRVQRRRARSSDNPRIHIEWLVRRRVPDPQSGETWSIKKIAREYGVSRETVKEGLERTADQLG